MIELVMRKFFACLSLARKYALIVIVWCWWWKKKYPETELRWVFISNFLAPENVRITSYHQGIVSSSHRVTLFFFLSFFPFFLFHYSFLFSFFSPLVTCFSHSWFETPHRRVYHCCSRLATIIPHKMYVLFDTKPLSDPHRPSRSTTSLDFFRLLQRLSQEPHWYFYPAHTLPSSEKKRSRIITALEP